MINVITIIIIVIITSIIITITGPLPTVYKWCQQTISSLAVFTPLHFPAAKTQTQIQIQKKNKYETKCRYECLIQISTLQKGKEAILGSWKKEQQCLKQTPKVHHGCVCLNIPNHPNSKAWVRWCLQGYVHTNFRNIWLRLHFAHLTKWYYLQGTNQKRDWEESS